jgi:tRNA pseudouridine38-40 synthase
VTRYALLIEYDGNGFVGWQRQARDLSVQSVLEAAASRLDGGPVSSVVAGRTDAGVHAAGQVVHMDLARDITGDKLVAALNFHLKPHRVAVLQARVVPGNWSARFSAIGRRYRYVILNRPARAALDEGRVWHVKPALDIAAMQEGAAFLLGRHDFTSFRASSCQAKSPIRTLDRLDVRPCGQRIVITAAARSFLHHQVRNMVGSLKLVGEGRWLPHRMGEALRALDRAAAGPTAPPDGLTLEWVTYEDAIFAVSDGALGGDGKVEKEAVLF